MQYCFLNSIYTDSSGAAQVYEVVFSNMNFTEVSLQRVGIQKLKEFVESKDLITDFSFEEDFLKSFQVRRFLGDKAILKCKDTPQTILDKCSQKTKNSTEKMSLIELLKLGAANDFCIVAEDTDIENSDAVITANITRFRHIKFSQSSMSIFVKEYSNNKIYNHYLIEELNDYLAFKPFYFLVPSSFHEISEFSYIGTRTVNNVEYKCYHTGDMGLIQPFSIIAPPLLNKIACSSVIYNNSCKALMKLIKRLQYCDDTETATWVDKGSHKHSTQVLKLKSSYKDIPPKEMDGLISTALSSKNKYKDLVEAYKDLHLEKYTRVARYTMCRLLDVVIESNSTADLFVYAHKTYDTDSLNKFYCDIYLYNLKCLSMVKYIKEAFECKFILQGSNEPGVTTVIEEGCINGTLR